ncbi:MAG: bifunctional pyr operon transcriptional regulator/uracil phosphoribosyltransferase PyrR [Saprospiraceae bacterium]
MSQERVILEERKIGLVLERIARHLRERYRDFDNTVLVGIQPRGSYFAERLHERLLQYAPDLPLGKLDITFFRDDFRTGDKQLLPDPMEMPFSTQGKRVILVDDVLYTGRTINAALNALQSLGRPSKVELCVMVERRFHREVPVAPDYLGVQIDAIGEAYVRVRWKQIEGIDEVMLYPNKEASRK